MSMDYSHHYSMDYSKQWPTKSQSTKKCPNPRARAGYYILHLCLETSPLASCFLMFLLNVYSQLAKVLVF